LAAFVPYQLLVLGPLPLLWHPPRLGLVPIAAACLFTGLGAALWLGNVNAIIVGLLCLAFVRGPIGGLALACAVAIKGYPIILLPLLWQDRARLKWFVGILGGLVLSGTLILGPGSWVDAAVTLMREGPHCDVSLNPFGGLGWWRVAPAALIVAAGWRWRSPTLTLLGSTFLTGVVTRHYLPTLAATMPHEPLPRPREPGGPDA
jgi:hypothetical protein